MTLTQSHGGIGSGDVTGLNCSLQSSSSYRKANDTIVIYGNSGEQLKVSFQRTVRVPDGKGESELPPSMGTFPLYSTVSFKDKLPKVMARKGGLFLPMFQREAMWIRFQSKDRFAVKIYLGLVNAVSGEPKIEQAATARRRSSPVDDKKSVLQDYVVTPKQLWLDGIASGDGSVRQFVATPLGSHYSVEAQVTGEDFVGGLQFLIIPSKSQPKPEKFPIISGAKYPCQNLVVKTLVGKTIVLQDLSPSDTVLHLKRMIEEKEGIPLDQQRLIYNFSQLDDHQTLAMNNVPDQALFHLVLRLCGGGHPPRGLEMGIAPGGLIKQCILEDTYPADIWEKDRSISFYVQILNSEIFRQVTGMDPPDTPISAQTYAEAGLPFYKIYNEQSTVKGNFAAVKSINTIDKDENRRRRGHEINDEPGYANPVVLLNHEGTKINFQPVSTMKKEHLPSDRIHS